MKKLNITLILYLFNLSFLSQEVISTQGGSYSNTSINIEFTIGEVVIKTVSDGVMELTQGFHQTNWNLTVTEDHTPSFKATIFPNPISEVLNIKTHMFEGTSYSVYNSKGKLILSGKLFLEQTSINLRQLPTGAYLLNLNDANQNLKTYKLFKTR